MDQEKPNTISHSENQKSVLRPWVTPAFERVELNEALSGGGPNHSDGPGYS